MISSRPKVELNLDPSLYCIEAVQAAAYRFIDRLAVLISRNAEGIHCEITIDDALLEKSDAIIADFQKELLDQQLRIKIKSETEQTRNLILSLAFSKSGLQK